MPRRHSDPVVFILGAGKLGTAFARALKNSGVVVTLRPARKSLPRLIDADVVILAVRDNNVQRTAKALVGVVARRAVVVHVAGALDATPLAPLRGSCAGVAQMHPMISFASARLTPSLLRGNVHVQGDPPAVAQARKISKLLNMSPRTVKGLDTIAYHAAAGLVANGAAALAALGSELLQRAGVTSRDAPKMLGPLLRSVADNVEHLGFPHALTGPVRRGDAAGVEKHLAVLRSKLPQAVPLYLAAAAAQLPLARALDDAAPAAFDQVAAALSKAGADTYV